MTREKSQDEPVAGSQSKSGIVMNRPAGRDALRANRSRLLKPSCSPDDLELLRRNLRLKCVPSERIVRLKNSVDASRAGARTAERDLHRSAADFNVGAS